MRRAMLTAGTPAAAPFTSVGTNPAGASGSITAARVWTDAQADGSGTVTNVSANFQNSTKTIAFFTIDASHVVRAVSADLISTAGQSDYTVSLAVQAGDRIGVWQQQGGIPASAFVRTVASGTHYTDTTTAKPTVGATLTATADTNRAAILGTP